MLRILLNGCGGRMGRAISNLVLTTPDMEISQGCDVKSADDLGYQVFTDISSCSSNVDVVIDFSHPSAFQKTATYSMKNSLPLVMATTGLTEDQLNELNKISGTIPVFYSANMSIGVNLLIELAKKAAVFTEGLFDIEIIEKHHNKKLDAPSGTAIAIANAMNDSLIEPKTPVYDRHSIRKERDGKEIGIHAIRGGTITGEHTVLFAGLDEVIEIKHEAMSRDIFASGAIKAASFIKSKPAGMYSMSDIINK